MQVQQTVWCRCKFRSVLMGIWFMWACRVHSTRGSASPVQKPAATPSLTVCSSDTPLSEKWLSQLPLNVQLVIVVDLDADLAQALAQLSHFSVEKSSVLPIQIQWNLQQFGLQKQLFVQTLNQIHFTPHEILFLLSPYGPIAWIWRVDCDFDRLKNAIERRWGLKFRATISGYVASAEGHWFPYDVLILGGDRIVFVPAQTGVAMLEWLTTGKVDSSTNVLAASSPYDTKSLVEYFQELDPAPIRATFVNRGLGSSAHSGDAHHIQNLRVFADYVEFNGKIWK